MLAALDWNTAVVVAAGGAFVAGAGFLMAIVVLQRRENESVGEDQKAPPDSDEHDAR